MKKLLDRLRAFIGNLAPRERMLVGGAAALTAVLIAWAVVDRAVLSQGAHVRDRLELAEQKLAVMERLRREYDDVNDRLTSVERRIRSGASGNVRTALEELASRSSVRIESMEPQASPANALYREEKVEVGLREVTLPQTIRYLHEIESAPQVLSVKALRIRRRPDKPELLDVTFTVSSFEPI